MIMHPRPKGRFSGIQEGLFLLANAMAGLGHLRHGRWHYFRRTVAEQICYTAGEVLYLVVPVGFILGLLAIMPLVTLRLHNTGLIETLYEMAILHDLSPLLVAFVVIGRSGSAITVELATMQVAESVDSLMAMGVEPHQFLVLPRLIGVAISMLILTFWCNLGTILGASMLSLWDPLANAREIMLACARVTSPLNVALTSVMVVCFAMAIVVVHSYFGFLAKNMVELSRFAPKAFMHAFLTCLLIELLFSGVRHV